MKRYRDALLGLLLLLSAAALLAWPKPCAQAVREGLTLFGSVLLPALFPFFVLSGLVTELGLARHLARPLGRLMGPLFRLSGPCAAALALGWVGGYPVGARTTFDLCRRGQCSRAEGEHLLAFCNCSGPAFILGVLGGSIFDSMELGLLLWLTHLTAALLVGLLFRGRGSAPQPSPSSIHFQAASLPAALTRSIANAAQSLIGLASFVLFFSVVLRCLTLALAALGLTTGAHPLFRGLLELSSGMSALEPQAGTGQVVLAAFLLGWGGLSIHCQVLALNDLGLSMTPYLLGKLLHGLLAALLTALALWRFPVEAAWFSTLPAETVVDLAPLPLVSGLLAAALWGLLAQILLRAKKRCGNRSADGV